MEKEPIIVLHVVGRLDIGGAESRIMDLYRNIDRQKVQFHFMQHTTDRCAFEAEVEALGGKVYHVPRFNVKNYVSYKMAWNNFFRNHPEIKIVHGHMTSTAAIYLPVAKKVGVELTIAHARSAGVDPGLKGYVTRFLRRNLYKKCDYRFTCSALAAEAVFGNQKQEERKAVFIPNAIEVDKFRYDEKVRKDLRYELGIEDKFVIGHVGRFSPMKNHQYMLRILEECTRLEKEKRLPETVLMFLGDGELKEEIMEQSVELGISSRVLFLGNRRDINRYYQAMDYFLLPSFYEGLPGTAIEAQAGGVPGIISDRITEEAIVTDLMQSRSIKEEPILWAKEIMKKSEEMSFDGYAKNFGVQDKNIPEHRQKYAALVREASFDIKEQADRMQNFYFTGKI